MTEEFTELQIEAIKNKEKENILKKLKSGGTLTSAERLILYGNQNDGIRYAKNQTELANNLGVDRKTIQRWRKENNFPQPMPDGRWDILAVRNWRENTRNSSNVSDEDMSKAEGEARRVWLQVEKLEHEIEVSKGNYITIDEAKAEVSKMASIARGILLAIPETLAPIIIGLNAVEAQEKLRKEIDHALEQIATDQMDLRK